jgi:Cell division GTPase
VKNRITEATKKAISSPLLEVSIEGANKVLLNITGGPDLSLYEMEAASQIVSDAANSNVNIIWGTSIDESLGDEVRVTVIATGIENLDTNKRKRVADVANKKVNGQVKATSAKTDEDANKGGQSGKFGGDWNILNAKNNHREDTDQQFADIEKQDFDVFQARKVTDQNSNDQDDDSDVPPFLKRRQPRK